jgi:hypothetical protein
VQGDFHCRTHGGVVTRVEARPARPLTPPGGKIPGVAAPGCAASHARPGIVSHECLQERHRWRDADAFGRLVVLQAS